MGTIYQPARAINLWGRPPADFNVTPSLKRKTAQFLGVFKKFLPHLSSFSVSQSLACSGPEVSTVSIILPSSLQVQSPHRLNFVVKCKNPTSGWDESSWGQVDTGDDCNMAWINIGYILVSKEELLQSASFNVLACLEVIEELGMLSGEEGDGFPRLSSSSSSTNPANHSI